MADTSKISINLVTDRKTGRRDIRLNGVDITPSIDLPDEDIVVLVRNIATALGVTKILMLDKE